MKRLNRIIRLFAIATSPSFFFSAKHCCEIRWILVSSSILALDPDAIYVRNESQTLSLYTICQAVGLQALLRYLTGNDYMYLRTFSPYSSSSSSSSSGVCYRRSRFHKLAPTCSILCTLICRHQAKIERAKFTLHCSSPIAMSVLVRQVSSSSSLAGLTHGPVMPANDPGWSQLCRRVQCLHEYYCHEENFLNFVSAVSEINKLVRLVADTVCGAANVNKRKDTTHPQG